MKAEINEGFPLIIIGTQVVAVDRTRIPNLEEHYAMYSEAHGWTIMLTQVTANTMFDINADLPIIASLEPIDPSIPLIPRSVFEKEENIKPCPFCAHKGDPVEQNTRQYYGLKPHNEIDFYLECKECGYCIGKGASNDYGDYHCDYNTREEALVFWNKREAAGGYTREQMRAAITWGKEMQQGMHGNILIDDFLDSLAKSTPKAIIPEMEMYCHTHGKDVWGCGCQVTEVIKTIPSSIEGYREIVVKTVIR